MSKSTPASRTIMIIDASPLIRSSASRMIQNAFPDLEVIEADRVKPALELLQKRRPMIVITDIHLQEGSGLKLTEVIASRFPDTTVVVFTNEDAPEYEAEALKRGANFFISKTEPNGGSILDIIRGCPPGNEET